MLKPYIENLESKFKLFTVPSPFEGFSECPSKGLFLEPYKRISTNGDTDLTNPYMPRDCA